MPTPSSRSKILPGRGTKANLDAALAAGDLLEGELLYAKDEDALYTVEGGSLVSVSSTGGSSQWVDGTAGSIYYNGGAVGIGTDNPAGSFEVQDGAIYISNSAATEQAWDIRLEAGTGDLELRSFNGGSPFNAFTIRRNLGVDASFVAINSQISNCPLDINWGISVTDRPTLRLREFRPGVRFVDLTTDSVDGEIVMDGDLMRFRLGEEDPAQVSTALANEVMTLDAAGNLNVVGNVTDSVSDSTYKTNITDASTTSELSDVKALQLRNWDWDNAPGDAARNARRTTGLVAQEAELVDPDLVYTVSTHVRDGEESYAEVTYKAIDQNVLVMKLVGAIQELEARVAALESP